MTVRQSTIHDLPEIVALLKQSIGEVLTPKTETYFSWKHEQNPFGRSKVLLAIEDGKIVGLRAFMNWKWASADKEFAAIRAVDTATDPAFQGKGIFKKLTLQALDECKAEGVDMVFNTPNPISMQGYLKMGWRTIGRLPLKIGIASLLPRTYSVESINAIYDEYLVASELSKLKKDWALAPHPTLLNTPLTYKYIDWRYGNCPVARYGAIIEPGQFGFIFRIKKLNRFTELRICDSWTENDSTGAQQAKKALKKLVRKARPALVSSAVSPFFSAGNKEITRFFGPYKKGPVITIRPLATDNLNNFEQFNNWTPSLGSMELF